MVKQLPVVPLRPQLLGARRRCPRGWEWNPNGNFCEQTSGGGSYRLIKMPNLMFGTASPATPAQITNETANDIYDPTTSRTETGGFDIMQFISDNALWLGLGAAGLLAIFLFSKKRR